MSEARVMELRMRGMRYERNYKKKFAIGPVTVGFISLVFLAVLAVFYLTQTNRIANKGYELASVEQERKVLAEERETLLVEAARLASLPKIDESAGKKMVKAKAAKYVVRDSAPDLR